MQRGLYVEGNPLMFATSDAISLLTGQARDSPLLSSACDFHHALLEVFDHPTVGRHPSDRLLDCRQGSRAAAELSLEFHMIEPRLRWPEDCL